MEKIAALERTLEIVNNEKARERSAFMGRKRETSMQHMVDSLHLNLKVRGPAALQNTQMTLRSTLPPPLS